MGESDSGQQYCLRWNNHSDTIISEFEVLLGQEDFVDVTLSCERRSVKAHKVVLSACSTYFRRLLKDNPCQHPIIILRDVAYTELSAILFFMYHGQVMVEQDRIPQLLQTAQLLEVRGLCEVRESQSASNKEDKEGETIPLKGNQSFLAGLLNTSISATKRCASVSDTNSCSNSSPIPSPVAKRQRCSGGSSRPVPMLQSILSQQLAVPMTPTFDLTKSMGSSTRALTALACKVQANTSSSPHTASTTNSTTGNILPTSLENLLNLSSVVMAAASSGCHNNGADISATSSSDEDINDKDDKVESSFGDMENSSHGGPDIEPDPQVVEIKEEPLVDFEDEFGEENSPRGAGGGGPSGDEDSESETELGAISENSRGEAFSLPLLAQHLAAPNLLSASAKLRAAASQARHLSTSSNDSMSQLVMGPSTSPDAGGPAAMSTRSDTASPSFDPLAGDPPRKLAFHEPRPCPICRRMYRDAATLRTHTAIMHAEGRDPFACLCGELFRTKYEMYNHKKNGHR
ncbi:hypothetical protein GHT06_018730 [Daphnia sinensis]|uniref:BTB domain-containing protein n=1 Tax=Daphnia sinensis TaxID=1820382 RepID=A0AAD5PQI5_9CRUS|nr:hypothetical protein GHT06_018730 [Daphnia sinensis]